MTQPSDAAQELLRRNEARGNLIAFTKYTLPGFEPADHHLQIADKLEAVAEGKIKRLMIFMPPRHGKSELASRRFPAWYLGKYPDQQIICASYNQDLASDFGRDVRGILQDEEYKLLFDTRLKRDSRAAEAGTRLVFLCNWQNMLSSPVWETVPVCAAVEH